MDFSDDPRTSELAARLLAFMDERVLPAESVAAAEITAGTPHWGRPAVLEPLKESARAEGLWNLFLSHPDYGAGLTNLQYAPLAEITGSSPFLAPEALNCAAPDSGNIELLVEAGTEAQKRRWLTPLLEGAAKSAFAMTEPEVASSDARNIATRIERDGDHYLVTGRKWWTSGVLSPVCDLIVLMGVTDPSAPVRKRHSLLLIPADTEGVEINRPLSVLGYWDGPTGGHAEVTFDRARVPLGCLLGEEGAGFALAQARLAGGRIHHCMRLVGMAERALGLMCERSLGRVAFGAKLAEHGSVREGIARSRTEIDQARLLVEHAAWTVDTAGTEAAASRAAISAIKAVVPSMAGTVIDRAVQVHGGGGLSQDYPLAQMYTFTRVLRIADGPDEVHRHVVAKSELSKYQHSPR
ncbi:acyl-CoA dehydrogenase family protein [Streptomyces sp. NPDC054796]